MKRGGERDGLWQMRYKEEKDQKIKEEEKEMMNGKDGLLVIDMQNDFCPGGALPVEEGDVIVAVINQLMKQFSVVVATQDWHPQDHKSFESMHPGKKPYDVIELQGNEQVLWPDHCVQGTQGVELHKGLDTRGVCAIFRKGMNAEVDSYSGFRDNSKESITGLDGYLKALGIKRIYLAGLATDYCVYYTGMDGIENGYGVTMILDATRGIDVPPGSMQEKLSEFQSKGGKIAKSSDYTVG